jgi:hypothetical protein
LLALVPAKIGGFFLREGLIWVVDGRPHFKIWWNNKVADVREIVECRFMLRWKVGILSESERKEAGKAIDGEEA